jgi:hypothetical protein
MAEGGDGPWDLSDLLVQAVSVEVRVGGDSLF